jgi:hypothetical protein
VLLLSSRLPRDSGVCAVCHLWTVRRFSAVFRWDPKAVLGLICSSDETKFSSDGGLFDGQPLAHVEPVFANATHPSDMEGSPKPPFAPLIHAGDEAD